MLIRISYFAHYIPKCNFFVLDQASNQALKEEINRLNAETRSLNRSYDERGLQIQNLQNQLDFCENKDTTQASKRK